MTNLAVLILRGRLGQDKELTPGGSSGGQDKELTPGGRLGGQDRECQLTFLRSPVEIVASDHHGRICGVKVEVNKLEVRHGKDWGYRNGEGLCHPLWLCRDTGILPRLWGQEKWRRFPAAW